ncbi:MAG TPA: molybdate ABC transporter substrate-binding protein [Pyrinomonadaceae bacterium]
MNKASIFYSSLTFRRPSFLFLVIVCLLSLISCARSVSESDKESVTEINVAAAANLSEAFGELGERFNRETGIRVVYSFGATAELTRQIENGAPFDVFAAADTEHPDQLNRAGLLKPGSLSLYARGRLVLWIPPASPARITRLEELTHGEIERIAIAKPDLAPYGRATVEALRALNLWSSVEPKVIYGQSVTQARQFAATGNAEAAFIPLSLVHTGEGRIIEVDERLHQPLDQSIAVINSSTKQQAAQSFVSFVLSPEGQTLLERYGYKRAVTGDK